MVASKPVLTYFNAQGRAEAIRVTFAVGGVEFEDKRIEMAEWPAVKPTMPFGMVPAISHDGVNIGQSVACLVYAGRLTKLMPSEPLKAARVLSILGSIEDMFVCCAPLFGCTPEERPAALAKAIEGLKSWGPAVDRVIAGNMNPGFCVGDSLTVADIQLYCTVDALKTGEIQGIPTTLFDDTKEIMCVYSGVKDNPKVKEWVAKRPTN